MFATTAITKDDHRSQLELGWPVKNNPEAVTSIIFFFSSASIEGQRNIPFVMHYLRKRTRYVERRLKPAAQSIERFSGVMMGIEFSDWMRRWFNVFYIKIDNSRACKVMKETGFSTRKAVELNTLLRPSPKLQ